MKTPWRISEIDARVSIVSADNRVVTEILPGQQRGVMVTQAVRRQVATWIVNCVNLVTKEKADD